MISKIEKEKFPKKWNKRRGGYTILTKAPNERYFYFLDFPFFADFDAFFFATIFNYIKNISYISFSFEIIMNSLFLI